MSWLTELATCGSTSTWAIEHLDALAHGDVVFTRQQTAGRGRDGRVWLAPAGTLTWSVVLDPGSADPRAVALASGLACIHAIADARPQLDADLALKWPNDVLLTHRKLAGILCELVDGRMVVGIGLNCTAELPESLLATSLHRHCAAPDGLELIAGVRSYLLEAIGLIGVRGLAPLLPQLRARDVLLGRSLSLAATHAAVPLDGIGGGIDEQGRLLLVVAAGGIAAIDAGHITAW